MWRLCGKVKHTLDGGPSEMVEVAWRKVNGERDKKAVPRLVLGME